MPALNVTGISMPLWGTFEARVYERNRSAALMAEAMLVSG
jgi:hypothetical protein